MRWPIPQQTGLPKNQKVDHDKYERYLHDHLTGDFIVGFCPITAEDETRVKEYVKANSTDDENSFDLNQEAIQGLALKEYLIKEMSCSEEAIQKIEECVARMWRIDDTLWVQFASKVGKHTAFAWTSQLRNSPDMDLRKLKQWIPAQSMDKFLALKKNQFKMRNEAPNIAKQNNMKNTFQSTIRYDMVKMDLRLMFR